MSNGSDAVTRRPGQTTNSCGRARSDPPRCIEISKEEGCFAFFLFRAREIYITEVREVEMLEEEILCEEPVFCAVFFPVVGPDVVRYWRYCQG